MSQDKQNEHEDTKEWETWMDNLIIEDTFQKENIPFYQYSEFENVKLIKLISGNIYKAIFKISQKTIILKCVYLNDKFTLDNLINEIKRYQKLEIHGGILKFYGVTKQENTNNYMIILKYSNNGSLRQYLKTNFQKMDWNTKLNLAKQIANVLWYLHFNEIIHGKLNSENILVHNGNIKLNVFGLTKIIPESLRFLKNTLGPIPYIDPQYLEIFNTIGKNKSSDIFSLGIILWEISSGNPPFEVEPSSNMDLLNNIVKGKREMNILGTPPKYKEIYTDCWKHNGNSRPNIYQVVKNLSEIIISDESVEIETQSQPYNVTDEVISVKLEISNKQNEELEVKSDPSFVDVSDEVNIFIKDLFEFFVNSVENQVLEMHSIMVKNYIREYNKNPVEILYEMISHQFQSHSHYRFTSLIGFFYKHGIGTIVDNKMAFKFFSLATNEIIDVKNNSPNSLFVRKLHKNNSEIGFIYLANMYLEGLGVKQNWKESFQIYSKVADEGSIRALEFVATCYGNGYGVKKNKKNAFILFLKSAEEGCIVAQFNVGYCYRRGMGTAMDESEAFRWYMKSALSGNISAMSNAGNCYFNGFGVSKDFKEAFKWFLKAAEKENYKAQINLAYCYKSGIGIEEDNVKAFEWYKKAAENEDIIGQYNIGKCFYEGYGTGKDIVKAIYWLNKAKENGNMDANKLLEEIINKMV
ncbi:hypothetical protein Glove_551g53 [Diversispora epigaea]|uniref:Protein kinase domain-containing protein n=1 Tax=Diversispora epigaea TaxID=1348612 RepID=A0A397GE70_9GLOM|nr:hypothetical protein Glove_551g53 [Diversispora epigaea]